MPGDTKKYLVRNIQCKMQTLQDQVLARRTVGFVESISNHANSSCDIVESIDLIRQAGKRSEALDKGIIGVGEVDIEIFGVHAHVVERVELMAVDIIKQYCY
jgi:hypothetical protein